jgi:hypothetical protein
MLGCRAWGGGLFTIGIAEEDRPRRWRAHRHCTNGRAVSPIILVAGKEFLLTRRLQMDRVCLRFVSQRGVRDCRARRRNTTSGQEYA